MEWITSRLEQNLIKFLAWDSYIAQCTSSLCVQTNMASFIATIWKFVVIQECVLLLSCSIEPYEHHIHMNEQINVGNPNVLAIKDLRASYICCRITRGSSHLLPPYSITPQQWTLFFGFTWQEWLSRTNTIGKLIYFVCFLYNIWKQIFPETKRKKNIFLNIYLTSTTQQ